MEWRCLESALEKWYWIRLDLRGGMQVVAAAATKSFRKSFESKPRSAMTQQRASVETNAAMVKVMPIAGDQVQSNSPSETVDDRRQCGVRSALGFSDHLRGGSTCSVRSVLVNFDMAAIDTTQLPARLWHQLFVHLRPELCLTPPAKAGVNRALGPKFLWQVTPRRTCAENIVNSTHHDLIVLRWSAASAPPGHTSCAGGHLINFLSAHRADKESPNDLAYS